MTWTAVVKDVGSAAEVREVGVGLPGIYSVTGKGSIALLPDSVWLYQRGVIGYINRNGCHEPPRGPGYKPNFQTPGGQLIYGPVIFLGSIGSDETSISPEQVELVRQWLRHCLLAIPVIRG